MPRTRTKAPTIIRTSVRLDITFSFASNDHGSWAAWPGKPANQSTVEQAVARGLVRIAHLGASLRRVAKLMVGFVMVRPPAKPCADAGRERTAAFDFAHGRLSGSFGARPQRERRNVGLLMAMG